MIFETTYQTLELPLSLMRALISDTEYKMGRHALTLEVGEKVTLTFYDKKMRVDMKYTIEDATPVLEGVATCSMTDFFEVLKSFKKAEDVLLIEREENLLRVDDGVYDEDVIGLLDDGDLVVIDENEKVTSFFKADSKEFSAALSRSALMLKKTDIPADELDTQSVYIEARGTDELLFNVFAIHHAYREESSAELFHPVSLQFPKTMVSLLTRFTDALKKKNLSFVLEEADRDEQSFLVLKGEHFEIAVKGKFTIPVSKTNVFSTVAKNMENILSTLSPTEIKFSGAISKSKASDLVVLEDEKLVKAESGFSAQMLNRFEQKNAWTNQSQAYQIVEQDGQPTILVIRDEVPGVKKMMTFSYRSNKGA